MKTSTLAAITAALTLASADNGCSQINGNWYCQPVSGISYTNFGLPGTYNKITSMADGKCGSTPFGFSGGMSPLDGEVSWHFRGPMQLKQFASYSPGSAPKARSVPHPHGSLHSRAHRNWHDRHIEELQKREIEARAPGVVVTATINGKIVSWTTEYGGTATTAALKTAISNPSADTASSAPRLDAATGDWARSAYYNAEQGRADGLVFLNNKGGQGSGVFDYVWGNSLSYASSDAKSGSSSPQILADVLLEDNNEISIFTSRPCQNNDCGTVRPGTVAHHGFSGSSKLFLLEFSMPMSGKTGFNADMPAAWILNADIPRTLQYGAKECSCWSSGCGEWDIFEVLDSENTRCKSTFHGTRSGGDSNWFQRPTDKTVKVAVVFNGDNQAGHIVVLDDGVQFGEVVTGDAVAGFVNSIEQKGQMKKFALPQS